MGLFLMIERKVQSHSFKYAGVGGTDMFNATFCCGLPKGVC